MFTNVLVMLYSTMHFSNMCIYIFFGIAGIITHITFEVSFGLVNMKVFLVLGKITHFLWIREKKIVNGVWMHNVAKKFTVCLWRTKKYFQQPLILFFMSTWGGDCKNMQEIQILWWFLSCLQFSPSLKAFVSAINYRKAIVGIKFLAFFCNLLIK